MILLAPLPTQTDLAIFNGVVAVGAGLAFLFIVMVLWGAASFWVDVLTRSNRVRVRPWRW